MTKERERGGENDRDVVIDSRIRKEKEKDRERERVKRGKLVRTGSSMQ